MQQPGWFWYLWVLLCVNACKAALLPTTLLATPQFLYTSPLPSTTAAPQPLSRCRSNSAGVRAMCAAHWAAVQAAHPSVAAVGGLGGHGGQALLLTVNNLAGVVDDSLVDLLAGVLEPDRTAVSPRQGRTALLYRCAKTACPACTAHVLTAPDCCRREACLPGWPAWGPLELVFLQWPLMPHAVRGWSNRGSAGAEHM